MRLCNIEKWGEAFRLVYYKPTKGKKAALPPDVLDYDGTNRTDIMDGDGVGNRLENNMARARTRIRELAACNPWDYFATLTLDPEKNTVYDLAAVVRRLGFWLQNVSRRYGGGELRYLLIPEQHKSGAYHFHGLFRGIPKSELEVNKYGYLDWPRYARAFGFISLSPVRDLGRCAAYITKYVSKDLDSTAHKRGEHLFYASKGLAGRVRLGSLPLPDEATAKYEGDWCGLSWYRGDDGVIGALLEQLDKTPTDFYTLAALDSVLSSITSS